MARDETTKTCWVFDALPPSGARRGGNPAEHAFRHDLATFIREVVQNANDQAVARPRVVFRTRALTGEPLKRFLAALRFEQLETHLRSAAKLPGSVALRSAMKRIQEEGRLDLLFVEDYGTAGLTGDELEGDSHFRALCKDTLFSHKKDDAAGGSYGLGKSVLWAFSSLSTVLFDSTLTQTPQGHLNPRLIGRSELPSHDEGPRRRYAGSGWFGQPSRSTRGVYATSVWGESARSMREDLGFFERQDHDIGTSICVIGFHDPTSDESLDPNRLREQITRAAARNFWPAMHMPRHPLRIEVEQNDIGSNAQAIEHTGALVEAWRRRDDPSESFEQVGDVAVRDIPMSIPRGRDGSPAVEGHVRLIVHLDDERRLASTSGRVDLFRGPGMVVQTLDRRRLVQTLRPFTAILACGRARQPVNPSEEDEAIERFLRCAEPPSHDEWTSTRRLKNEYHRGYAKALKQLFSRVDETLRDVLSRPQLEGRPGPERLQRRFPIGRRGRRTKRGSAFRIRVLDASYRSSGWTLRGMIEPTGHGSAWTAELGLAEVDERGRRSDPLPVVSQRLLSTDGDPDDVSHSVMGGVAVISALAGVRGVEIEVQTEPTICIGALEVEIVGRHAEEG